MARRCTSTPSCRTRGVAALKILQKSFLKSFFFDADNVLEVGFEKNPLHLSCSQFDNVYVWVWCPEAGVGYLANAGGVAALKILQKSFLKSFFFGGGKEVHVYAFVQDEGGRCAQNPSKIFFKIFLFSAIGVFFLAMSEKSRIFAI